MSKELFEWYALQKKCLYNNALNAHTASFSKEMISKRYCYYRSSIEQATVIYFQAYYM